MNNLRTAYLLDGGNVVAEVQNNTVTDNYLRGVNLSRRTSCSETEYYLFNAHGDVVTTTNLNGTVNQSYDYDAFGNEKNPDALDTNPFRYCGEYLDFETGSYYLRARYYDPSIGRFSQQDTHWNTANMIYGDNPQKINEREDKLGLKTYTYTPQVAAVLQSGNLYAYCLNNPLKYGDTSGKDAQTIWLWAKDTAAFLSQLDGPYPYLDVAAIALLAVSGAVCGTILIGEQITNIYVQQSKAADSVLEGQISSHIAERIDTNREYKNKYNLHHVVAQGSHKATEAQSILHEFGIDYKTDSRNLILLNTRFHVHLHTDAYYAYVNQRIIAAYTNGKTYSEKKSNVINELARIKEYLRLLDSIYV